MNIYIFTVDRCVELRRGRELWRYKSIWIDIYLLWTDVWNGEEVESCEDINRYE